MRSKNSKSSTGRLSWMLSDVLKSKRAEGYVDTAVKVLIAVVIGALLLFGLYGLVGNVVIPTTTSKVSSLFNTTGVDGAGTGGGAGGGDTPVTPEPEIKREPGSIIPDGAKYTKADGTELEGNGTNVMPEAPNTLDTYEDGDYKYLYGYGMMYGTEWCCRSVLDDSKTGYGIILSEIAGKPVTNLGMTFYGCANLTVAPEIPSSVTDMYQTFQNCTSLTTVRIPSGTKSLYQAFSGCTALTEAPVIPEGVTNMYGAFERCTGLTTAPVIPDGVTNVTIAFQGCTGITVAPSIPDTVTTLSGTFYNCTSLKTYVGNTDGDGNFSNYKIPENVLDMSYTFLGAQVAVPPMIPNKVTYMNGTFNGCKELISAPVIPSSVTNMQSTFAGCTALTGTIEINATLPNDTTPPKYDDCFKNTVKPITITGSCTKLAELAATANNGNVTVG